MYYISPSCVHVTDPHMTFAHCKIVRRELGAPINELFVRFDKEPIAAAVSI